MGGGAVAMRAGMSSFNAALRSHGSGALMHTPAGSMVVRPFYNNLCDAGLKIFEPSMQVQFPAACELLDDWEFANYVDNDDKKKVVDHGSALIKKGGNNNNNKGLFGKVPSIVETMEATSELNDAIQKVFLSSPKSSGKVDPVSSVNETKACITRGSGIPKGALQAFALLNENPAAQSVVASIASDPNVWVAVMQNPAFLEFAEKDRKYSESETHNSLDIDNDEEPGTPDGFMSFIKDVKVSVVDMVSSLTSFIESLFADPDEVKDLVSYDSPKTILAGGTFMALAMMVMMVVLMKRE